MVQAIGGMVNQGLPNVTLKHNTISLPTSAPRPGQKSFSMSPTGEITPGPDNMEPYSQDKEQKQKAALGKQALLKSMGHITLSVKTGMLYPRNTPGPRERCYRQAR